MRLWTITLLFCLEAAAAEPIGVGIKIGVPVTENLQAGNGRVTHESFSSSTTTRRYTLGLTASIRLPARLGVEVDALYRRVNYDSFNVIDESSSDGGTISSWSSAACNRLDFPVLLRWSPGRRLYLTGGPVFAVYYGFDQRTHTIRNLQVAGYSEAFTTTSEPFEHGVSKGATFGVGFDAPVGRVRLKPELRYTHWISAAFENVTLPQPTINEAEFLLGVEFGEGR